MDIKSRSTVVIAGGAGDLGKRVIRELVMRGAIVRALVLPAASEGKHIHLKSLGAIPVVVDATNLVEMTKALRGSDCVISTLNGLRPVIIDRQSLLLKAAVEAGVPRFIPSEFSADFTKTPVGRNRNFDLRREFKQILDASAIQPISIMNGAFMDMLGAEMPIIQPKIRRVLYWNNPNQKLDFTTKDNVAAVIATMALDPTAPRTVRVAGQSLSAIQISEIMSKVSGKQYRTLRVGSLGMLDTMIKITKLIVPGEQETFPPWQGMQYMRDQFSGDAKLEPINNDLFPSINWTKLDQMMLSRTT